MSDVAESTEPKAHARIAYLGPVSPHWEVYGDWGDRQVLDEFRARVLARLVLLPREDPQFRRNRERVVRDAEREMISIEWDLGVVAQPATRAADSASDESATDSASDENATDSASDESATDETVAPDAEATPEAAGAAPAES